VIQAVSKWKTVANSIGISKYEQALIDAAFKTS
jgi:hypothetical protein